MYENLNIAVLYIVVNQIGNIFGNSHSIICQTHMNRRSIPQLEKVRSGIIKHT